MTKKTYTVMVMVLLTATVLTAATAFAGTRKKIPDNAVSQSVAKSNMAISSAMLHLKTKRKITLQRPPGKPPVIIDPPPQPPPTVGKPFRMVRR